MASFRAGPAFRHPGVGSLAAHLVSFAQLEGLLPAGPAYSWRVFGGSAEKSPRS